VSELPLAWVVTALPGTELPVRAVLAEEKPLAEETGQQAWEVRQQALVSRLPLASVAT